MPKGNRSAYSRSEREERIFEHMSKMSSGDKKRFWGTRTSEISKKVEARHMSKGVGQKVDRGRLAIADRKLQAKKLSGE